MLDICGEQGCCDLVDIDGYNSLLYGKNGIRCSKHMPKCNRCGGPEFVGTCPQCQQHLWAVRTQLYKITQMKEDRISAFVRRTAVAALDVAAVDIVTIAESLTMAPESQLEPSITKHLKGLLDACKE